MKIEDLLMHQTDVLMLPAGQTLFTEGEAGDTMYVLVSGTADILLRGKVIDTVTTGAVIGEMADARAAGVCALRDAGDGGSAAPRRQFALVFPASVAATVQNVSSVLTMN